MKRSLFFILLLSITQDSWAVIALVAHSGAPSADSVIATTAAQNTTGATLIVVGCIGGQPFSGQNATDSSSNTWTQLTVRQGGGVGVAMWYVANPTTSASHTFSCSNGVNLTYPSIYMTAYSGTLTSLVFDSENGYTGGSFSPQQTGSVTPAGDGEVFVTASWLNNQSSPATINLGFTVSDTLVQTPGISYGGAMAYLIQGTGAAVNPTWTGGGADVTTSEIASFKPSVGGGANTVCPSPFCGLLK